METPNIRHPISLELKYPDTAAPHKRPMGKRQPCFPRPVDEYFAKWHGPKRKEFREDKII